MTAEFYNDIDHHKLKFIFHKLESYTNTTIVTSTDTQITSLHSALVTLSPYILPNLSAPHIFTITTNFDNTAPDHIRAIFDQYTFNEYTLPPLENSTHSTTTHNDVSQCTRSTSTVHQYQYDYNNLTLSGSLPSNDNSDQPSVPATIHNCHHYPLNNDHNYTPSINDMDTPRYHTENKFSLHSNTFDNHTSTTDVPDDGYDNDYND